LDPQSLLDPRRAFLAPFKISSPSNFSHDTKTSKLSEKDNPHEFHPKNFNHAFSLKIHFKRYRNNAIMEFDELQNYIGKEFTLRDIGTMQVWN
jgi:hypothetical protein